MSRETKRPEGWCPCNEAGYERCLCHLMEWYIQQSWEKNSKKTTTDLKIEDLEKRLTELEKEIYVMKKKNLPCR